MRSEIKKKRLIFFLPNFSAGGASESILKLVKFLIKKNFSILLISIGNNYYKKQFVKTKCEVIEIKSTKAIFSIFKIRKIIIDELKKKFKKIIFISNINYANVISIISLINLKKVKIVLTERSSIAELKYSNNLYKNLKNRIIYFLAKNLYKFSDLIITNSEFEKKFIKKKFNIKNIICIHPPSIKKIIKIKNNYNNKIKKIIFVGRLSYEKGIFTILKALVDISSKYKFLFNIYGDGPEKNSIKRFIKINNLNKKVSLKGFVNKKKFIFRNANLFINASLWEGLPNAMVQSINYNVFPICSDAPGGNIEVIKNGKFGTSFKKDNYRDLRRKILQYFRLNIKLSITGRAKHLKKFTENVSNEKYLNVLNKL